MTAVFPSLRPLSREICRETFIPPNDGTVDQWADQERYLSPEGTNTPAPIRWDTAVVPYAREIMQALTDPDVHHICLVKPRQVAGTEIILNWLGHTMDWSPAPHLVVQATGLSAKNFSKERLAPMLRDTPALRGKVRDGSKRRDSDDTIDRKAFSGGYIGIISGRSTAQMRMRPIGRIAYDERDESEEDLKGQGDPLEILMGATATFWDWKLFEVSTPVDWYTSPIWGSWKISDQRLYDVPCPFCNGMQPLVWRDGEGDEASPEGGEQYRLVCDRDERDELIPESARYQCAKCDKLIEEKWKGSMLAAGVWTPRMPGRIVRGYRLGGLYSFLKWSVIIQRFQSSKDQPAKLKTFVNLTLGLPFREQGERIEPHFLQLRAESYGNGVDIPHGVGAVLYGVDVQAGHLEVGVWGVGPDDQWWVICQMQLVGDPGQPEVWAALKELLDFPWRHASGRVVRVGSVAIDAGFMPDKVHAFAKANHQIERPVIATIGREGRGRPVLTAPAKAKKWKKGQADRPQAHVLGSDAAKDALHSALRVKEPGPGYVHFPETVYRSTDDEIPMYTEDSVFYDQLTAEELKTVYERGRPVRRWVVKEEGRRNDSLDCANNARAAHLRRGPKAIANLRIMADFLSTIPEAGGSAQPVARVRGRIRSSGIE